MMLVLGQISGPSQTSFTPIPKRTVPGRTHLPAQRRRAHECRFFTPASRWRYWCRHGWPRTYARRQAQKVHLSSPTNSCPRWLGGLCVLQCRLGRVYAFLAAAPPLTVTRLSWRSPARRTNEYRRRYPRESKRSAVTFGNAHLTVTVPGGGPTLRGSPRPWRFIVLLACASFDFASVLLPDLE